MKRLMIVLMVLALAQMACSTAAAPTATPQPTYTPYPTYTPVPAPTVKEPQSSAQDRGEVLCPPDLELPEGASDVQCFSLGSDAYGFLFFSGTRLFSVTAAYPIGLPDAAVGDVAEFCVGQMISAGWNPEDIETVTDLITQTPGSFRTFRSMMGFFDVQGDTVIVMYFLVDAIPLNYGSSNS